MDNHRIRRSTVGRLAIGSLVALALGGATLAPAQADPIAALAPLFTANYSTASIAAAGPTGWRVEQEPQIGGVGAVQTDRLQVVTGDNVPGTGPARPTGALRAQLLAYESRTGARDGDVTITSGYAANRAEVYGRYPDNASTAPVTSWPDPVGSERWYTFAFMVPVGFGFTTDTKWTDVTQWKGFTGGTPPVAIEIKRDALRLGGARTNAGLVPGDGNLGKLVPGQWTSLTVGLKFSTDATVGWVNVFRDGVEVLPRTSIATMDTMTTATGVVQPDPTYLKQGIYRATTWKTEMVMYFGPITVSPAP
jgi:hypothetical protein